MANLVVRNLDPRIVGALKRRAARNGRSVEAEHRALLKELLLRPKDKRFAEALASMPNVGENEDFERVEDPSERDRVFDRSQRHQRIAQAFKGRQRCSGALQAGGKKDIAQRCGRLRVPHIENAPDKQIAATALVCDLTVVTRNHKDFSKKVFGCLRRL